MDQKINSFVSPDLKTTLTCPQCSKTKRADVSKFMLRETQVKLKCRCACGHQFSAVLERRRSIRKEVSFPGRLILRQEKQKIRIKDLSMHGLKINLLDKTTFCAGDKIGIQFNIDDPLSSIVSRDVRIKELFGPTEVGCEFLNSDHTGNLGKYFLFYF